jgi:hypothetical protein
MPSRYVRSTDGNNADDGSTWALADADISASMGGDAAGDTTWISDAHAESTAAQILVACAGTAATPSRILCGDDAVEPPTALATTATAATSHGSFITFTGSFYAYGVTYTSSAGANGGFSMGSDQSHQVFEQHKFRCSANDTRPVINIGSSGTSGSQGLVQWKNCTVRFANASQKIVLQGARLEWLGGGIESGGTSPTVLVAPTTDRQAPIAVLSGLDLSAAGTSLAIFGAGVAGSRCSIRNSKLPASWAGSLVSGTLLVGSRSEMWNCDAGDVNYALWVEDYAGSIKHETTLVKTGGASNGTTAISWKMATSANAEYPVINLRSPEIAKWNETTGSAVTVTVDFLRDSATNLQDDEIWLEVEYLGTSGFPLSLFADDAAADVLATPADQATSAATWTTTGMSNPNEQKLSVTFTPQEKGLIIARVCVGLASTTIYVDPELQVS